MRTREFEQSWIQQKNEVNNSIEKNVFIDFYSYITTFKDDLNAIKQYYKKEFKNSSSIDITFLISKFEEFLNIFNQVAIKKEKLNSFCCNIFDISDINEEIYIRDNNSFKIKDEFYPKLKYYAEKIFELENYIAIYNKNLWQNAFTDINTYNKDLPYCLLAHVDHKNIDPRKIGDEFAEYSKNQKGICCSVITDKKTRLYDNTNIYSTYSSDSGQVGIIVKPKNNCIVAGSYNDMLSTEFVNDKCELKRYFSHSKIAKCFDDGVNTIYCLGTKIFTPKHAFDCSADTINEVILEKENCEIVAVFYTKSTFNEIPKRLKEYKEKQEKIAGHELPVIEIKQRNKLKQVDLENLY